jgi:hypothetical protein
VDNLESPEPKATLSSTSMKVLSAPTSLALRFLSSARILVGTSSLLLPTHAAVLFGASPSGTSAAAVNVIARLFGSRDLVLGGYLWVALSKYDQKLKGTPREDVSQEIQEREPLTAGKSTVRPVSQDGECVAEVQHLRTALWLGLTCDIIDVVSTLVCVVDAGMGMRGMVAVTGGAVLLAALGVVGLRVMK